MASFKLTFQRITSLAWFAEILAGVGALIYGLQSAVYIHQIIPTLDESSYLYKGYLFVTGVYWPYQDYGPLTNKMPLSFLIPGWVQAIFGPGLRSGRYFAIALGLLMLLGLWLTARRLSGRWWATGVVWAVAINPILIKMYAQMLSEGLVAAMLPWVFFLLIPATPPKNGGALPPQIWGPLTSPGDEAARKGSLWRTILGGAMLGIVVATRQNMIVMAPFVLVYIFWQHGRRAGWWGLAGFALPLLVFHALYWPNILTVWLAWVPRGLLPFLDGLRPPLSGTPVWNPQTNLEGKLFAFWTGIRHHFIAMVGSLCTWLFWPKKSMWKSPARFKAAVLLSTCLLVLTVAHAAAAFGADYCQSCFSLYLSFFSEIGLLLTAVAFSSWAWDLGGKVGKVPPIWGGMVGVVRQGLAMVVVMIVTAGTAYAAMSDLGPLLMNLPAPRLRSSQVLPGSTELWRLLTNKYNLSYDSLLAMLPIAAGLLAGLLIIVAALMISARTPHPQAGPDTGTRKQTLRPGVTALLILLLCGTVLTPSLVLGGGDADPACGDVIAAYEAAGAHLASLVPPGSLVFWEGGLATAPLLYMPGVRIFPPQLNDGYSHRTGGNAQLLYQHGYWNDELAQEWLQQANYVLVEGVRYDSEMRKTISPAAFNELPATQPLVSCPQQNGDYRKEGAQIRIFRREP